MFRMEMLHCGLGGGESESALSVSQLPESGKRGLAWRGCEKQPRAKDLCGRPSLQVSFVFRMLAAMRESYAGENADGPGDLGKGEGLAEEKHGERSG